MPWCHAVTNAIRAFENSVITVFNNTTVGGVTTCHLRRHGRYRYNRDGRQLFVSAGTLLAELDATMGAIEFPCPVAAAWDRPNRWLWTLGQDRFHHREPAKPGSPSLHARRSPPRLDLSCCDLGKGESVAENMDFAFQPDADTHDSRSPDYRHECCPYADCEHEPHGWSRSRRLYDRLHTSWAIQFGDPPARATSGSRTNMTESVFEQPLPVLRTLKPISDPDALTCRVFFSSLRRAENRSGSCQHLMPPLAAPEAHEIWGLYFPSAGRVGTFSDPAERRGQFHQWT